MDLKRKMVSGAAINLAFAVLTGITSVGNILVMGRFLKPEEVGLFALSLAFVESVILLSDFGVKEKLVQDNEAAQDETYRVAFTVSVGFALFFAVIILSAAPVVSWFYEEPVLWPLLSAMSYAAFTGVLTLPLALYYKELRFLRYRAYPVAGRITGLVTTVLLAYNGAGVWSLAFGGMATLAVTALPLWLSPPVKWGWCFDLKKLRSYISFSLNLWGSKVNGVTTQHGAVFVISGVLSMKEMGQFKLAEQVAAYAFLVEIIIAQTIFPALCRVQDNLEEMKRLFVITCKISMIWAAPLGMALAVFANDIVRFVFSDGWEGMEILLQIQGMAVMFGSIAYAWDNFLKARGSSAPTLIVSTVLALTFFAVFVPAIVFYRYVGIAIGIGAIVVAGLVFKQYYMGKLFPGVSIIGIVLPELGAATAAGGMVVLWKSWAAQGGALEFVMQLSAFSLFYLALIILLERKMVFESLSYIYSLRKERAAGPAGLEAPPGDEGLH